MADKTTGQKCLRRLITAKAEHALTYACENQADKKERESFAVAFSEIFTHQPQGIRLEGNILEINVEEVAKVATRVSFLEDAGLNLDDLRASGFVCQQESATWLIEIEQSLLANAIETAMKTSGMELPGSITLQHLLTALESDQDNKILNETGIEPLQGSTAAV